MADPYITIPDAFADAFIALANEANDHPDELDLGISDDRLRLWLSNSYPGFSPYLQMRKGPAGNAVVEVRSQVNNRDSEGNSTRVTFTDASVRVDLTDPYSAAQLALECWLSTL
ncbi:hypothetical protein RBB84_19460 [Rhodococcus sp. D-6]|uniref:Uncharacterized protein n=2 Tax=Rhodococcus TaxID=1827 RepID=A0A7M2XY33_9NOCA|nr:hypothetical protein [Rhodococcus pyridinivorans]QOW01942.1 hypothetical protein INP59_26580 [Rhodococcus pyridinivorans]